jgi:hypothetical protein
VEGIADGSSSFFIEVSLGRMIIKDLLSIEENFFCSRNKRLVEMLN